MREWGLYVIVVVAFVALAASGLIASVERDAALSAVATAYARGYAAAVDSVRAHRTHDERLATALRAYGIRYDFVLTLRGERDSVTAVVRP